MSLLSASMLAELEKSSPNLRRSLLIEFQDGNRRYSDVALCSSSLGYHEPLVKKWGRISDAVSDRKDVVQIPEWNGLQIIDTDGVIDTLSRKYELRGVRVTLVYCSKNVAPGSWLTRFVGIIKDLKPSQEGLIEFVCGPDDRALTAPIPTVRLSQADFSNLPKGSEQLYVPISPYGRHDSFGLGNIDGQIQPVYVGEYTETNLDSDTITGSKYIIGLWPGSEILHAYSDDVRLPETEWNAQSIQETVNGRTYFRIMFDSNRSAQKITLDVLGIIINAGITLVDDPLAQIMHLLSNLAFNEVMDPITNGYMAEVDVPEIDWDYVDETTNYLDSRLPAGARGSGYIPASEERQIPLDLLEEHCRSFHYKVFWSYAGKLSARPDSVDHPGYLNWPWIRRPYDELTSGPLQPLVDPHSVADRMMIEGAYGEALGQFQQKLLVVSPRAPEHSGADTIPGTWLQALI